MKGMPLVFNLEKKATGWEGKFVMRNLKHSSKKISTLSSLLPNSLMVFSSSRPLQPSSWHSQTIVPRTKYFPNLTLHGAQPSNYKIQTEICHIWFKPQNQIYSKAEEPTAAWHFGLDLYSWFMTIYMQDCSTRKVSFVRIKHTENCFGAWLNLYTTKLCFVVDPLITHFY